METIDVTTKELGISNVSNEKQKSTSISKQKVKVGEKNISKNQVNYKNLKAYVYMHLYIARQIDFTFSHFQTRYF